MKEQRFIEYLESLKTGKVWARARAALRRSLAFDPGLYPPAFPFVEPFLDTEEGWTREAFYLVAGLYAQADGNHREGRTLARALANLATSNSRSADSVERRFLALLDADRDQIAHRLRSVVSLVEGELDFAQLLSDLRWWFQPERRVQARWAREYYRLAPLKEKKEVAT